MEIFSFSKTKKEEKLEKESRKVKKKKMLQRFHRGEKESSNENTSDMKPAKQTKVRHKDDSHISSEEEVDIGRGEGDIQSSSDEDDEENFRFEIAQVWTSLQFPPYHHDSGLEKSVVWSSFSFQASNFHWPDGKTELKSHMYMC